MWVFVKNNKKILLFLQRTITNQFPINYHLPPILTHLRAFQSVIVELHMKKIILCACNTIFTAVKHWVEQGTNARICRKCNPVNAFLYSLGSPTPLSPSSPSPLSPLPSLPSGKPVQRLPAFPIAMPSRVFLSFPRISNYS